MKKFIYFDNAATTPPDNGAVERMLGFLQESYGNADSPHAAGEETLSELDSEDADAVLGNHLSTQHLFHIATVVDRTGEETTLLITQSY